MSRFKVIFIWFHLLRINFGSKTFIWRVKKSEIGSYVQGNKMIDIGFEETMKRRTS